MLLNCNFRKYCNGNCYVDHTSFLSMVPGIDYRFSHYEKMEGLPEIRNYMILCF